MMAELVLRWLIPAFAFSMLLCGWRVLRGPTMPDRVVGLEILTTLAVGLAVCTTAVHGQRASLDVALVLALLAFLGTVAYARALGGRG
jgi:multisubunit Na+/H+ antiporter MnhF subunit